MTEKIYTTKKLGMPMLLVIILGLIAATGMILVGFIGGVNAPLGALGILLWVILPICIGGLKVLKPQEALVLTLFGKYKGSLKGEGFYFVNPFCTAINPAQFTQLGQSGDIAGSGGLLGALTKGNSGKETSAEFDAQMRASRKISLKVMTLSNSKQKVNDALGNPVEIGVAVMWRVVDTAKAVFDVDNYKEYLSLQADTAVRSVAKVYPYDIAPNVDTTGDGEADDGSLRGSTELVAKRIKDEIQAKVEAAGLEIIDARITHLAYSPEIAAVMLQRQQARAVVDARKMIVDGAVGMVEMALDKLNESDMVTLDEERKAAMVSNLLVVLCAGKDAQPVVNSGSLY
ncbi:MAG: SPFH domain-containing protein [Candidatus Methanomethylophilus sp.]|nr:SPFH domain-containing protein [Methanomethylophilus sp.]